MSGSRETKEKIPVLVIFAPTACGKTAFVQSLFGKSSLSVFKEKGEVISADSQAVYKGLDIGTAKPSAEEIAELPCHMINLCEPTQQFDLGDFVHGADRAARDIYSRGKLPLLVGGTGFYIRAFLLGLPSTPEPTPEVRERVKEKLLREGKEALRAELEIVDPESARRIHPNDLYRTSRALEIFYTCGKPQSSFLTQNTLRKEYNFCTIILTRNKEELMKRIDLRVEEMFRIGLKDEVENLKKQGFTKDTPAMKAIGYSEFFDEQLLLQGDESIKNAIKIHSRQYAKKQYTFMRGIPGATFVDAKNISENLLIKLLQENHFLDT